MRYVNLHTHHFTADPDALEVVNQYPLEIQTDAEFYSIGIHPYKIAPESIETELNIIESHMSNPKCIAIGECGLDKRIETPLDQQEEVFARQLLLAKNYRKPVVIHCVGAYAETIAMKKRLGITTPMIIHGFSKSAELAKQLTDNGFYVSFGKYLLRNPELSAVFKSVPNDRFFLETDMIEEPLAQVYKVAATAKGISLDEVKQIVNANFATVFGKR